MARTRDWGRAAMAPPGSELHDILVRLRPDGRLFHVLSHFPDEDDDHCIVLVDDRLVIAFEYARDEKPAVPREAETYTLLTYQRGLRGVARANLETSLRQARNLLGKQLNPKKAPRG